MENFKIVGKTLVEYNGEGGDVTIPDGVRTIGAYAFYRRYKLTSITIPNGVTSIDDGAFEGCINLTSVSIPDSVKRIGPCAFYSCSELISATIGKSVNRIGRAAFCGTGLTSAMANYKAFSLSETGKLKCLKKIYTVGKRSMVRGDLELCINGIHYCTNLFDIFSYYRGKYGKDFVIGVCKVSDENISGDTCDSKRCARWIIPTKILTREEVINLLNNK